jgi:glycosyltransferase involved in cell wall biosynthesis
LSWLSNFLRKFVPFTPIAVLSVDLSSGMQDLRAPSQYRQAHVLIRYRGLPLCNVRMKVVQGRIRAVDLWTMAWWHGPALQTEVLRDWLGVADEDRQRTEKLPSATIVVCTRNRTSDLKRCLDSLVPLLSDDVEALVIDNNPSDDETRKLVSTYPVRYYREDRPGLNWARARAVSLASTDLLLFTDDDVAVDRGWATQMRIPFAEEQVGAVTGAVVPMEFEHPSQEQYEEYGGFNRGFAVKKFDLTTSIPAGAGRAGAGASMAVRRSLATEMGLFDCELDCGTPSYSGGDFYAFYHLIRAGYSIVYWPEAIAWHRHRQTYADLKSMLYGYGVGVYSVLLRGLIEYRDIDALFLGLNWFRQYHLRELLRSLFHRPGARPAELIWAEIRGVFHAPAAYRTVRNRERDLGPLKPACGVSTA